MLCACGCGKEVKKGNMYVHGHNNCSTLSYADNFWGNVDIGSDDECWLWTGTTSFGYGQFTVHQRHKLAHRVSYELVNGPIPKGKMICHKCNTPLCVNPKHLYAGTAKDNHDDMIVAGTSRNPPLHIGENQHCAKLTESDVVSIREMYASGKYTMKYLGKVFGTRDTNICAIVHRQNWKHVP